VKALTASVHFYCSLLGFRQIRRPELGVKGVWVFHDESSISVHLLEGSPPERRWSELDGPLENRDHVNFLTSDINLVEAILKERGTFFHKVIRDSIGIIQIFLSDPDGNIIEIGSCGPPPDEVVCRGNLQS
jgi:catechol 2,3-dioxygenase-like lactoylglutathione lyase family enzyme